MPILRVASALDDTASARATRMITNCTPAYIPFWASGGFWVSKVLQNGRFPAQDAENHRAKFDAARFILGGEIRNRKNKQKHTNSNRYIHTLPIGICG